MMCRPCYLVGLLPVLLLVPLSTTECACPGSEDASFVASGKLHAEAAPAEVVTIDGGSHTGIYINDGNDVIVNNGQFSNSGFDRVTPFVNVRGGVTVKNGGFSGTASNSYGYGFHNGSQGLATVAGGAFLGAAPYEAFGFYNGGTAVITGGNFVGAATVAWSYGFTNTGRVTIDGGSFSGTSSSNWGYGFRNEARGTVIVNGGRFSGQAPNWAYGFTNCGTAIINGGSFVGSPSESWGFGFKNEAEGIAVITGGQFSGGHIGWRYGLYNDGTMTIYGTFARYGELEKGRGKLAGVLANGTPISVDYENYGSMIIRQVPEPSSALAIPLGIGGLVWRRKR